MLQPLNTQRYVLHVKKKQSMKPNSTIVNINESIPNVFKSYVRFCNRCQNYYKARTKYSQYCDKCYIHKGRGILDADRKHRVSRMS